MAIARSTYYEAPAARAGDVGLLAAITVISDEFEFYGWRRVQAALRHQGIIANHKRIKRLMREHDCGSACKRDPLSGVIGVQEGPLISVV